MHIISFMPYKHPIARVRNEQTKAQRDQLISPRSHSKEKADQDLNSGCSDSKAFTLPSRTLGFKVTLSVS